MSKTEDEFLDHFARLGVFSKVQFLMGSESDPAINTVAVVEVNAPEVVDVPAVPILLSQAAAIPVTVTVPPPIVAKGMHSNYFITTRENNVM